MISKSAIISQLQKDILLLQGFKTRPGSTNVDIQLGPMKYAFPNASFPVGAIHEFCCSAKEDAAVTTGFIIGILSSLMKSGGASVWISSSGNIFPPALKFYGINPDQIIFIKLQKDRDILWAMEEALKCDGLAAVVGEINEINFASSRRLQLAVEQSRVTGFILHPKVQNITTTACVSRWRITSLASLLEDDLPGVGFPRWNVELLKIRNGSIGAWQIEWRQGRFRFFSGKSSLHPIQQKKTG